MEFQLYSCNSVTGTFKAGDTGTKVPSPSNTHTMPDMGRLTNEIFSMVKHVRCGYDEGIVGKVFTENVLLTEWEPDLLQEDNAGQLAAENLGEIVSVPLEAFHIEREH